MYVTEKQVFAGEIIIITQVAQKQLESLYHCVLCVTQQKYHSGHLTT